MNRFAILEIDRPPIAVLQNPKTISTIPPKIFVLETNKTTVDRHLKSFKMNNYVLESVKEGTNICLSHVDQHASLMQNLIKHDIPFSTRPPPGVTLKRFVLYGLNSTDGPFIMDDLKKYGIQVAKLRTTIRQKPKYHDHCNYVIYVPKGDGITLDIISYAKYINHTKVWWNNYIVNGDGTSKCSNCHRFYHPADHCTLPSRCGVCAGSHKTGKFELIQQKNAQKSVSINTNLLCCVHCNGKHTAGFTGCPVRVNYRQNRPQRNQRPTFEPVPAINPWSGSSPTPNQHQSKLPIQLDQTNNIMIKKTALTFLMWNSSSTVVFCVNARSFIRVCVYYTYYTKYQVKFV